MTLDDLKALSPLDRLVYWITERESVRLKRKAGEQPPWTADEILRKFKFTNIRRMDDRVSRWLLRSWYIPYKDHPNVVTAAVLARQLNNPDSLEEVGFPGVWDPVRVEAVLNDRVRRGLKNFSAAYMITGTLGGTKVEQIVRKVVSVVHDRPPAVDPTSMERTVKAFVPYPGFSSFIAGQVTADLRWAMNGSWADRLTWAPLGPGSKRGMNRLHGRPKDQPLRQPQFLEELTDLFSALRTRLPRSIWGRLEAQDVQSCCCEWDKYERAVWDEGTPKQLYRYTE